ncbi:MAG: hypothetical protein HN731_10705 [Rhodospirillaceae bacterium]|jgi:hypothetical protein|nr:hypothetical protein [Rhodospirillaceae bacterium]
MSYEIKKRIGRWGFTGIYDVFADGEDVGEIQPRFKTTNSNRAYAYWTEVRLEEDALTDETGFPNEYRTFTEAKAAVVDLMRRNGYV